jgi:hypothetical protein
LLDKYVIYISKSSLIWGILFWPCLNSSSETRSSPLFSSLITKLPI